MTLIFYYEINDDYLQNWPHKYIFVKGLSAGAGYHNMPAKHSVMLYDQSDRVVKHVYSTYEEYAYYLKNRFSNHTRLTDDEFMLFKLSSIEL